MVREVFSEGVAYEHRDLNKIRELLIKNILQTIGPSERN